MGTTDYETIELDLDEDIIFYLKSQADKYNITINEFVETILKNYIDIYEKQSGEIII